MSQIIDRIAKQKLKASKKTFTRNKALKVITAANCHEDRFVKHPNSHVKSRAAYLSAHQPAEKKEEDN